MTLALLFLGFYKRHSTIPHYNQKTFISGVRICLVSQMHKKGILTFLSS
jgi:hypothetical protein